MRRSRRRGSTKSRRVSLVQGCETENTHVELDSGHAVVHALHDLDRDARGVMSIDEMEVECVHVREGIDMSHVEAIAKLLDP